MTQLKPLPAGYGETRSALHELAERVISPARKRAIGRGFLVPLPGGFGAPEGTPRVDGVKLVGPGGRREPITSLAAAARLLGEPEAGLSGSELKIEPASAEVLASFYTFAQAVLDTLKAECEPEHGPSRITLWPEHFDLAFEFGSEDAGCRAGYGASPGDCEHAEPYLYVGPWREQDPGQLWQATGFAGAELLYSRLGEQPEITALEFYRSRRDALLAADS